MTRTSRVVIGEVDTHKDVHVAAVIDEVGKIIDTASFATSAKGCAELSAWMRAHGELVRAGVEGTGCYGAGLARLLEDEGLEVVEVNRPNRQARRRRGTSDTVDAEAAARAALNGEATVAPKTKGGAVESIRVLRVAFTSARRARTQVALQIRDLIVTAPDELRAVLGSLSTAERVARCARFRLGADPSEPLAATRMALRTLARRYEALSEEMGGLEQHLDDLTAKANPALRGVKGVGVDVAAILLTAAGGTLIACATRRPSPPSAASHPSRRPRARSSATGSTAQATGRRTTPCGASSWCASCDERTKTYAARRRAEGKSDRDIVRCLKRYVAREVFRCLTAPEAIPVGEQLRVARKEAGLSLATVAQTLGTWPIRISRLERSLDFGTELARRYETLLAAASDASARPEENAA